MAEFSTKVDFDRVIKNIWEDESFKDIELLKRGFAIQDIILKDALMFIGINPSYDGNPGNTYYNHSHGQEHRYFKKFVNITKEVNSKKDLSKEAKLDWTHLDLLFIRETSQSLVRQLYEKEKLFLDEQLKISKQILIEAQPKIIVVNNTFARDLLKSEKHSTPKFDPELGTEKIISPVQLKDCPVFFTSMLTGQRALDLGSYARLVWHIEYVLKKIS